MSLIAVAAISFACSSSDSADEQVGPIGDPYSLDVSRSTFVGDWPLTVDEGTLHCDSLGSGMGEVTFSTSGSTYGVNGLARGTDRYLEIDDIWAPNPEIEGLKVNMGDLIDAGLALC